MVEAMEPRPRLDGRFFPPILRVVVMVTWGWSMASAWVRCLVVEVGTSGSSFTTTLGPSATPELILLHTALCASRMNSSSARSLCSAWICSCSFLFFSSCSSTCPCRVSVWSTLLFLHLAAASLFLSLLCLLLLLVDMSLQGVRLVHPSFPAPRCRQLVPLPPLPSPLLLLGAERLLLLVPGLPPSSP